jgi:hypothetical protein
MRFSLRALIAATRLAIRYVGAHDTEEDYDATLGGQKAWLQDSLGSHATTIPGRGMLVASKAGLASIPVYGAAYPSSCSTATLESDVDVVR